MLYHLSGDDDSEMGKSAKKKAKQAAKKAKKAGKTKKKKVAKVLLAPARASFIAVIELNLLKMGTKLARVWNKQGGKDELTKFWKQFGGDPDKLKKAIQKGSKQTIQGDSMGVVGATAIATATPIIVKIIDIIKKFGAGGDAKEKDEFDKGVDQGMKDLNADDSVKKGDQDMPEGSDVALIKKKGAGTDAANLGMATNPISICMFIVMLLMFWNLQNPILKFVALPFEIYSLIGFCIIPFSEFGIAGEKIKTMSRKYFDVPAKYFNSLLNFIAHGKEAR